MNFTLFFVVLVIYQTSTANSSEEGNSCGNRNKNGVQSGICTQVRKCPWALTQIRRRMNPDLCGFVDKIPIFCCPSKEISSDNPVTERLQKDASFGKISVAKCEQFYPVNILFAYAGIPSLAQEFPHMAILGYGLENDIQWGCGGSLISLQHVLTAAHCLHSLDFGDVKFVRIGDLDIKDNSDAAEPQDFTVSRAIPHPDYEPRTAKHDIAVIELNKEIVWTEYVKPACLHVGNSWEGWWPITATGWGITKFAGESSSHLLKVELKILDNASCRQQYINVGARGNIDNKTQVCADSQDSTRIMDTCQGDSGGPLQVTNFTETKHYSIIGVTSFGKACGLSRSGGIYTRVSYYIPWIESTVWNS